jgi:hypothetical protein
LPRRGQGCGDPKAQQADYDEAHVSSLMEFLRTAVYPETGSATSSLCETAAKKMICG